MDPNFFPNLIILGLFLLYAMFRFAEVKHVKIGFSSVLKSSFYLAALVLLFSQYLDAESSAKDLVNASASEVQTYRIAIAVFYITAFIASVEFVNSAAEALEKNWRVKKGSTSLTSGPSSLTSGSPSTISFVLEHLLLNLVYVVAVFGAFILLIWIMSKLLGI